MIKDSRSYYPFVNELNDRIGKLTITALNPATPYEQTQIARVRLQQLQEVLRLATGEVTKLK